MLDTDIIGQAGHFVPKFYLKGFMDQQHRLWIYERGHVPRASTPKKAAVRPDFYRLEHPMLEPQAAEQALAEAECRIAPTLKKISNISFTPSPERIFDLLMFAALSFARVPTYLDFVTDFLSNWAKTTVIEAAADRAKFEKYWANIKDKGGTDEDAEVIRKLVLAGNYNIKPKSRDMVIALMFSSMQHVAEALNDGYECEIWNAPAGEAFVTSDNPVVTLRPNKNRTASLGVGFGYPDTELIMPLTKRCCLHASRSVEWRRTVISALQCQQINRMVMGAALSTAFGSLGTRRQGRLFDQYGCKLHYGKNAFIRRW